MTPPKKITSSCFLVIVTLLSPESSYSQSIDYMGVNKQAVFEQTSSNTTQLIGYSLRAFIEGSSVSSTFPSSSNKLITPNGNTRNMFFDEDTWEYESYSGELRTKGTIDSQFPDGTYTIEVGLNDSATMVLTGDEYPSIPSFNSDAGSWIGGKWLITESEAQSGFTIITSSNGTGQLTLDIVETLQDEDIVSSSTLPPDDQDATLVTFIPGGTLILGGSYKLELESDQSVYSDGFPGGLLSWTSASSRRVAFYSTRNTISIEVIPNPTSGTPVSTEVQIARAHKLSFDTIIGRTYQLESSDNLDGTWSYTGQSLNGSGENACFYADADKPREFYRVTESQ